MAQGLRLSCDRAVAIGWALLAGPVATAVYSLTVGGSRILWLIAIVITCAALFLLALGHSWIIIGSSVRVVPSEEARIALLMDRANSDDIRFIDVLVTQCVSVRWFVQKMAECGKDVRLLIHDPQLAHNSAQRTKCIQSLYDVVTSLSPTTLPRLNVHAYNRTPSVRAIVLRNAKETPLYASVGWYSHLDSGIGGSRYPAVIIDNRGQPEKLLMKFVDNEVNEKRSAGRPLSFDEIIQLFNSSKVGHRRSPSRSLAKAKAKEPGKNAEPVTETSKDAEPVKEPL